MLQPNHVSREKPLILIVDDVPKNLQVLGNILGADQYLITPAMSGEQALARVEQLMPDLILLDVMMPGIDGFETCRQIKANPRTNDIPIIFLTAKTETVDVVKGFKVGAVDYVLKPFQAEELLTRVETQISLRKKTTELKALYEELRQNEKKYRGLFVSSIDAILRINASFQIKDANPGAELLFGQSVDCLIKKELTEFLATKQQSQVNDMITQQVVVNGYSEAFESEILKTDCTNIPVEMRLWRSEEDDSGLWILFRDISERKAMRQLREDVDRIMRHDLKNPLSGIIGLSDMLKMLNDGFSDEQNKWIDQIQASGRQALDMINHSLDIFKMEQGRYLFHPVPCNLVAIFKKIEGDFFQLFTNKKLTMEFFIQNNSMNDKDVYSILGEKLLLETVFDKKKKNAIEASPKHQTLSINVSLCQEGHEIVVSNQGVIPEDIRGSFFDKYTTSGKKTGTGLGTYSAKLITETHGGTIRFHSNEQDGTQIIVTLPTSPHDIIQHKAVSLEKQLMTNKDQPVFHEQIKILAADDSPNNMLLIGHYLERLPCVLDLAENGEVCVDYFKSGAYDLVLIDLQMPVMDGFEAVMQIRAYEKENGCSPAPIVALSADNNGDVEKKCMDIGCNAFISKPFSEQIIQDMVIRFCRTDKITAESE